jgi:diaminopimelate epimerase
MSRAICDRHYGIGADGLLLLMPSDIADFKMRIFNADGSESEICGNGLRCMVRYYLDKGHLKVTTGNLQVETSAGIRKAEYSETTDIKVSMGKPGFSEDDIPVKAGQSRVDIKQLIACNIVVAGNDFTLNLVSMGNPHAVYFTDNQVADFPLSDIGPEIATSEIFPQGANFEVTRILDRENIEARVWERGVGETLASGSGACAIAVVTQLHEYAGSKVNMHLPGGMLKVDRDDSGEVYLSGPAETVYTGKWEGKGVNR